MDVTGEPRWSRSKYPLQGSAKSSVQPPLKPPAPQEPASPPRLLDELPKQKRSTDSAGTWHHAVTSSRSKRYSITSLAGSDSNTSTQHLIDDIRGLDGSSTAFSVSQRSLSPSPFDQKVLSRNNIAVSDHLPSVKDLDETDSHRGSSVVDVSTPSTPPPRQVSSSSGDRESVTAGSPSSFTVDEQAQSSTDTLDRHGPTKRTLRRIPRSQRIRSPIPAANIKPGIYALNKPDLAEQTSTSGPWKRKSYPVHATSSASVPHQPQSPPQSDTTSNRFADSTIEKQSRETAPTTILHQGQSFQPGPSSHSTPTQPASHPAPIAETKTQSLPKPSGKPASPNSSRVRPYRQAYPLQSPASVATLRPADVPTKEPDTKTIVTHNSSQATQQEEKKDNPVPKLIATRRQAYPLQSPASNINLSSAVTPPESPTGETTPTTATDSQRGRAHEHKSVKPTAQRRQKYPLQSPASLVNLHTDPTPPASPERETHRSDPSVTKPTQPNQREEQNAQVLRPQRRQKYPLQSPASIVQLRSQNPMTSDTGVKPEQDPMPLIEHTEEEEPAPAQQIFRRQTYPLERTASIPSPIRPSPKRPFQNESGESPAQDAGKGLTNGHVNGVSTAAEEAVDSQPANGLPSLRIYPATENETHQEPNSELDGRKHKLASSVVKHWRRQVYPVQSPKEASPFLRASTPLPPEVEQPEKPATIHLPKNIRALKSAEENHTGRTIVVCLDGTGDKFDNDNSNIVHIVSALKKDDAHQVTYYQAGIGTYSTDGLSSGAAAAMDMAVGSGLGHHVREAYQFLMHTYKEGDKICIFGFSRGAYTARCLAGMVHKVGLLPPRNYQQIPFAYEFYSLDTAEGWKQSEDFKKTFCIDVNVYFLGCFDSVASVGFIPRQLPLSTTPTNKPRYFRHAMALDERRAKFKVCRHQKKTEDDIKKLSGVEEVAVQTAASKFMNLLPTYHDQNDDSSKYSPHLKYGKHYHPNITDEEYARLVGGADNFDTDVLEVWFTGAHADVGGGAVPNDERHKLAQIPLRWMIRQAFECDTGIIFKTKALAEYGLDVHTLWPKYERLTAPAHGPPPSLLEKFESTLPPREIRRNKLVATQADDKGEEFYHLQSPTDEDWTPEQVEDFYDAMSVINDQLIQAPTWWILEMWPVQYKVPIAPGKVEIRTGMNLGRYRGVEDVEPNLHWTVVHRMQQLGYKINARTAAHTRWQTVV